MNLVIDSSVVVAALIDGGPAGQWAAAILPGGSLQAPNLILAEAANVLRRLERATLITTLEANAAHDDLMLLNIQFFQYEPFAERVWELRHNVTSYDAWYVAVAEALRLPLATLDKALVKANGPTCKFLTPPHKAGGRSL